MIVDEEVYLEHHGVKGMRWGKRGTKREQKNIDMYKRVAEGKGSGKDALNVALRSSPFNLGAEGLAGAAAKELNKGKRLQDKINAGEAKVTNILNVAAGVKIKNLDYSYNPSYTNKLNKKTTQNRKMVKGILAGAAAVTAVSALQKVSR